MCHVCDAGAVPRELAGLLVVRDDRVADLLGGMMAGAPPEVFAGVWSLVGSVLPASDYAKLGARLGM